jgi:ribose transport system ATP-binding protein
MNGYRVAGDLHNCRDYGAMSEGIMNLIHKIDAA